MADNQNRCPACSQHVPPDQAKIEIGENGLIVAASVVKGLGPPLIDGCSNYSFFLDDKPMPEVVAFDCREGLVWRYQRDKEGNSIIRDGKLLIREASRHCHHQVEAAMK